MGIIEMIVKMSSVDTARRKGISYDGTGLYFAVKMHIPIKAFTERAGFFKAGKDPEDATAQYRFVHHHKEFHDLLFFLSTGIFHSYRK
jgi:hypothetical protein